MRPIPFTRRPATVGSLRLTFESGEPSLRLAGCEAREEPAPGGYDLQLLPPRGSVLVELLDRFGATVYRQVLRDAIAPFSVCVPTGTSATDVAVVAPARRTILARFVLNGGPRT